MPFPKYCFPQVITCSLGKGIKLNRKRRKNQKRFYNVTSKRARIETAQHDINDTIETAHQSQSTPPREDITSTHDNQLLDGYLEHQEAMQMKAKTTLALREKHKAPSNRKQMFDILKGRGLYKKFPAKDLRHFKTWLQSPSGGQLKCPQEIISEISRFVFFKTMSYC